MRAHEVVPNPHIILTGPIEERNVAGRSELNSGHRQGVDVAWSIGRNPELNVRPGFVGFEHQLRRLIIEWPALNLDIWLGGPCTVFANAVTPQLHSRRPRGVGNVIETGPQSGRKGTKRVYVL